MKGALVSIVALALTLSAQEPPATKPARSLAAGLVRQHVEVEKLSPPAAETGVDVAAGQGPLALLVRRADGTLATHALERGPGDHGPAAGPVASNLPPERDAEVPPPGGKAAPAREPAPVLATLRRVEQGVAVTVGAAPLLVGKTIDRAACRALLSAQRPTHPKAPFADVLTLDAGPDIVMQDLLLVWELARDVGWKAIRFDGTLEQKGRLTEAARAVIAGLPAAYGWKVEYLDAARKVPLHAGELLVLVDATTAWGDVSPLAWEFARNGIWQFGFVVRKDATTFLKLPTHLAVDR